MSDFVVVHAECVNEFKDSVCHIVLVPFHNGLKHEPIHFYMNPKADVFRWVQSGLSEKEVDSFKPFIEVWGDVEQELQKYPMVVSTSDGYSVQAIYKTLMRLDIPFKPFKYVNIKPILRKSEKLLSYSFDFLNQQLYKDYIDVSLFEAVALRWFDVLMKFLADPNVDIEDFCNANRIRVGYVSADEFIPCRIKPKDSKTKNKLDLSGVEININEDHPFYNHSFVFTGKMDLPRADARRAVVAVGGLAPENVTKDLDYLVVGTQDLRVVGESGLSGKMKKAASFNEKGAEIEVITEQDFMEMLNS
ncbi:MAG: hypothetical protein HDR74_06815 [Bacteroides sp.]|nr:hypothetical protein [Bacteroides sp.]